jgi:hypothetical protein
MSLPNPTSKWRNKKRSSHVRAIGRAENDDSRRERF